MRTVCLLWNECSPRTLHGAVSFRTCARREHPGLCDGKVGPGNGIRPPRTATACLAVIRLLHWFCLSYAHPRRASRRSAAWPPTNRRHRRRRLGHWALYDGGGIALFVGVVIADPR